jgi:hypothetical protein
MSKRQLIQFLGQLSQEELQEQLVDLYGRFKQVKEYYDFSFSPNEEKRFEEARLKISREYFPEAGKKVRKRRSVGQKLILHLQKLEANPVGIADLMLYQIEVAQVYNETYPTTQESFYKSMLSSFQKAYDYISKEYLLSDFSERIQGVILKAEEQRWMNREAFKRVSNR